jgi:hypothetical protein
MVIASSIRGFALQGDDLLGFLAKLRSSHEVSWSAPCLPASPPPTVLC